jgi:PPK2 family polyphosphate:nucleotide phosphotransferase
MPKSKTKSEIKLEAKSETKPERTSKPARARLTADDFVVRPGRRFRLADRNPTGRDLLPELGKDALKARAQAYLQQTVDDLAAAQELLYANDRWSVLVIFQAMDAAGKDGAIKYVMSGINPQGCQVFAFKVPSAEELDHDFLWRYNKALPERGRIGIFNRSYYEEVLVVRVHPEILARQKLPEGKRGKAFWRQRFEAINHLEARLAREGTLIVKFFLNVSKDEQKRRFLERLDTAEKHWKFSSADIDERQYWDAYMDCYEEMLGATSTEHAPWYVVPADRKYVTRALVAGILKERIDALKLKPPVATPEQLAGLAEARRRLMAEK